MDFIRHMRRFAIHKGCRYGLGSHFHRQVRHQHIGYLQAKVLKNGLKLKDFERRGVYRSGWQTSLFCLFDAADNMAIGAELYYQAKVSSFRDSIPSGVITPI